MQCPNCGAQLPAGAVNCPACKLTIVPVEETRRRTRTASDSITGVLFLLLGVGLLAYFGYLLSKIFSHAWGIVTNFPGVGALPAVLVAAGCLLWCLAGVFLIIGGIISLSSAKGTSQANGGLFLMILSFVAYLAAILVHYYGPGAPAGYVPLSLEAMGLSWISLGIQLAAIVLVFILLSMKKSAKRKMRQKNAEDRVNALNDARAQAEILASGNQPAPAAAPQPAAQAPTAAAPAAAPAQPGAPVTPPQGTPPPQT